jgi:hypothetical protein
MRDVAAASVPARGKQLLSDRDGDRQDERVRQPRHVLRSSERSAKDAVDFGGTARLALA